ncbi:MULTISPECIES: hypothetical protein [Vibrio]|uniref:hypothetical protein n=1 Tax=Vibrio TaxID=662 RepID=UPI00031015D5|nr:MULTISPECIES: hypothetical protein [Vibrio]OEF74900.1 hypothetical protein A148_17355 [Vibrio splendidus 1F-157]PMO97941.1 hypothetical protein BCS97_09520 [Vibrio splendidus]PMP25392.1 hypothetical protein BCS89_02470 [Vibrio splendidus]PMP39566.1 hypothetical protein BCS87_09785 [Vibrio splendidus]PMP41652.1 hypothetical protein BCS88_00200 [Vibrio splendidus]
MHQDYQITARVQEITTTFIQKKLLNEDSYPQNIQETVVPISGKAQKRAKYQFPISAEENDSIICEYDRVMNIYNKHHYGTRKKLTVTMEQWFLDEAKRYGWADAKFYKCDGSTKKACFLVKEADSESSYDSKH